jgi:hypothetical protein
MRDLYPGSGALLTPGSGSGMEKNLEPDPGSGDKQTSWIRNIVGFPAF